MTVPISFTFGSYEVDVNRSALKFTYTVMFSNGTASVYTDKLYINGATKEMWGRIPKAQLEKHLQSLLIMLGINYWMIFPVKTIKIEPFSLSKEQADFWNTLYLNGLAEYFYVMKSDFRDLIRFPYDASTTPDTPIPGRHTSRALLLNGAGKDSILSAELLKSKGIPFDFFAFSPTLAHERIARLVGVQTISVTRRRDLRAQFAALMRGTSSAYPSVSTFTFIAALLAELFQYDSIVFSNERSADFGNCTYLGLQVNHQWCKSSEAEKLIQNYLERYVISGIKTYSLLRTYSEIEIVRLFARYPRYFRDVTSCNTYFWLSPVERFFARRPYWCGSCPKCVFLFACFSAFLPKKDVVRIFGSNIYTKKDLLPLIREILGVEGHKPLDCVGEPGEMILAMHYASQKKEYAETVAIRMFKEHFNDQYDFSMLERKFLAENETL